MTKAEREQIKLQAQMKAAEIAIKFLLREEGLIRVKLNLLKKKVKKLKAKCTSTKREQKK